MLNLHMFEMLVRKKSKKKKNKIKIKLNPKKKIGYEVKSIGPGGKSFVRKRRDMPGKDDIGESTEVMESFEFQFADKETAQEFMREISQKRLGSSTGTAKTVKSGQRVQQEQVSVVQHGRTSRWQRS